MEVGDIVHVDDLKAGDIFMIEFESLIHIKGRDLGSSRNKYFQILNGVVYDGISPNYKNRVVYLGNIHDIQNEFIVHGFSYERLLTGFVKKGL